MTTRRNAAFDLTAAIRAAGFTPRAADAEPLLGLLLSDDETIAKLAQQAVLRIPDAATAAVRVRLAVAAEPERVLLARLLGRLDQPAPLLELLAAPEPRVRRAAISALGRLLTPGPEVEPALLAAWTRETERPTRHALVEALGKVGGASALAVLTGPSAGPDAGTDAGPSAGTDASPSVGTDASPSVGTDADLARLLGRATLMLSRTTKRGAPSRIRADVAPPAPIRVRAHCRAGLAEVLADELGHGAEIASATRVELVTHEPLGALYRARTMLRFGLVLPRARGAAEVVIPQLLAAASTLALLRALTDGPIRWRLAWAGGGHRRASVYRIAEEVARRCPELENDPTASAWEVVVREDAGAVEVELEPSALEDPRFSWRRTDVAAASHPTLAAALARLAGVRARDVVWDPFVGSGSELIERARLGPYAALIGSDLDPRALVAARENLAAAGVAATLDVADACAHAPAGVTLIITNPPMGRRVHRGDIGPLLDAFVDHVARVLVPGGRMAWLSPVPRRTRERALLVGLRFSVAHRVDMGGFDAEFQLLEKPVRPGTR